MITNEMFEEKERLQSHSYVTFTTGHPYVELGWQKYAELTMFVDKVISDFRTQHSMEVFHHEHELLAFENTFIWWFSFFGESPEEVDNLTKTLRENIDLSFAKIGDSRRLTNNRDEDFDSHPYFQEHYVSMVMTTDVDFEYTHPPRNKSYEKEDLDLKLFQEPISAEIFRSIIRDYIGNRFGSIENLLYIRASDGFHSTRHEVNKLLREEFIPSLYFIDHRKTSMSAMLQFGMKRLNFDLRVHDQERNDEVIVEITSARPDKDHEILSMFALNSHGTLPLKASAKFKKMIDSLPSKIVRSINDKHKKNYSDNRELLVVIPSEYVSQGEPDRIRELIDQVNHQVDMGRGTFKEISLLCDRKIYKLFQIRASV